MKISITEARERLRTADMAVLFGLPLEWVIENILKENEPTILPDTSPDADGLYPDGSKTAIEYVRESMGHKAPMTSKDLKDRINTCTCGPPCPAYDGMGELMQRARDNRNKKDGNLCPFGKGPECKTCIDIYNSKLGAERL